MASLLTLDPAQRPSAAAALQHPFLDPVCPVRAILHAHAATGSGKPVAGNAARATARAAVVGGFVEGSAGGVAPKPNGILAVPEDRNLEELQAHVAGRVFGVQSVADRRLSAPGKVVAAEAGVAGELGNGAASRNAPTPHADAANSSGGVAGKPGEILAKRGKKTIHVSVDCLGLPQHAEACSSSLGSQQDGGGEEKEPPPHSERNVFPGKCGLDGRGGSDSVQMKQTDGGLRERLAARGSSMNRAGSDAGSFCNAVNEDAAGLTLNAPQSRQAGPSMGPAAIDSSEGLPPAHKSNVQSRPQGARAVLPILPKRQKLAQPPEEASQRHCERLSVQISAVPDQAARKRTGTEQIHTPRTVENAKDRNRGLVTGPDGDVWEWSDGLIGWRRAKHCDNMESELGCVVGPPAEISRCDPNLLPNDQCRGDCCASYHDGLDHSQYGSQWDTASMG